MNSFRVLRRQVRRGAAALGILGAVTTLSLAPALIASANAITSRSISLSSSVKSATNVSYNVDFTTAQAGTAAFVVEFCADSPAVGTSCEAPAGFNISGATTPAGNTVNALTTPENNAIEVTLGSTAAAGTVVTVPLNNVTNPSAAGALYARIVTYTSETSAKGYTSTATPDTYLDSGSAALSITDGVNVNGEVLESLVFCTTNTILTNVSTPVNCSSGSLTPPSVKLGVGNVLSTTTPDTGTIYTGISTNANGGAVVNMQSNAAGCGGLINSSAPTQCYITPVTTAASTIASGAAQFGMMLTGLDNGTGTGEVSPSGNYSATKYFMDYSTANPTTQGITSTYGSPVYSTNGAPISNGIVGMTFAANAGNETPAGNYSADMNLIATGTF